MLAQLENSAKVVGAKQTKRALKEGKVSRVFLAKNADPAVIEPIEFLSGQCGVEIQWIDTMKQLGQACGIAVGAAVAAIVF